MFQNFTPHKSRARREKGNVRPDHRKAVFERVPFADFAQLWPFRRSTPQAHLPAARPVPGEAKIKPAELEALLALSSGVITRERDQASSSLQGLLVRSQDPDVLAVQLRVLQATARFGFAALLFRFDWDKRHTR